MILAKDFIETAEGLVFAVVESGLEQGKVLCFLRYIKAGKQWEKVNTEQANNYLAKHYPQYLYYSPIRQAHCHALSSVDIFKHHQAKQRVKQLLLADNDDAVEKDCIALCLLLKKQGLNLALIGITGSILISAQKPSSDIDLVFYTRDIFNQARTVIKQLIEQGSCQALADNDWLESYHRRQCDLSYPEYLWHEKRKFNKALINGRKFDLSFVSAAAMSDKKPVVYKKLGSVMLHVKVLDASLAFDYPAQFTIDHPEIKHIVCYTATYTGQAKVGEWVEVAGLVEQAANATKRIIVGSNREASGEYIKVVDE